MGVKFFDYVNEDVSDLFLTDMHSDMSRKSPREGKKTEITNEISGLLPDDAGHKHLWAMRYTAIWARGIFGKFLDQMGTETYCRGSERSGHQRDGFGRRVRHRRHG